MVCKLFENLSREERDNEIKWLFSIGLIDPIESLPPELKKILGESHLKKLKKIQAYLRSIVKE